MRTLSLLFGLLAAAAPLIAQKAGTRDLGTSCSMGNTFPFTTKITASALPKLGTTTTLSYDGPNFFQQGQYGNWSSAVSYMFLGLTNPNLRVGSCTLFSSAEVIQVAQRGQAFDMPLFIPNDANLLGFKLYAQGAYTYINVVCLFTCRTYTGQGASGGLELTLGR